MAERIPFLTSCPFSVLNGGLVGCSWEHAPVQAAQPHNQGRSKIYFQVAETEALGLRWCCLLPFLPRVLGGTSPLEVLKSRK